MAILKQMKGHGICLPPMENSRDLLRVWLYVAVILQMGIINDFPFEVMFDSNNNWCNWLIILGPLVFR